MAKKKYKKKPEVYYAIQYSGTNNAEMTDFCYLCIYDAAQQKLFFGDQVVQPTYWIMHDNAEIFSMLTNENFNNYFSLDQSGP